MTIDDALKLKAGESESEKILAEFKTWLENEIADNILHDRIILAEFLLELGSGTFRYGKNKTIIPQNKIIDFAKKVASHIVSVCKKYNFKFYDYVGINMFDYEGSKIIGGKIKQKNIPLGWQTQRFPEFHSDKRKDRFIMDGEGRIIQNPAFSKLYGWE